MRLPIGLALGAPNRLPEAFGAIDWSQPSMLTFEPPDPKTFRCLALAYDAGRAGGTAPAVLSAANEIAVEAFLNRRITFLQISQMVRRALERHQVVPHPTLDQILAADAWARQAAAQG